MLGILWCVTSVCLAIDIPKNMSEKVVLEETGDVLTLRGASVYKHFGEDVYQGIFYSLNPLKDPKEVLRDAGPKRMIFYFHRPTLNFSDYLEEAIKINNPPELIEREQINLGQFLGFFNVPFESNEIATVDFVPNVGVKVTVKGIYRGTIKGETFSTLVLKIWMGRQPPSTVFQKNLFYNKEN